MEYLRMEVTLKGINEVDATIQLRKRFSETNLVF